MKIVTAAISRYACRKTGDPGIGRTSGALVQNVNAFYREAAGRPNLPATEHVVVFDEAQRAWDSVQNGKKTGNSISQPESMLGIMDRHPDWAVVVALVGGGQEIHNGEAGLSEWGRALHDKFPHWDVLASPQALDGDLSLSGQKLFADDIPDSNRAQREPALHLAVNLRSFRAVRVAEWVEALLRGDSVAATKVTAQIQEFPIAFTRSLERARGWLRIHARGLRRCGLVASSSAVRLRAFGSKSQQDFAKGTGTCTSTGIWRRQRT